MGLPRVYGAHSMHEDVFKMVPDRSPGVPVDFEQIDFVGLLFCIVWCVVGYILVCLDLI